MLTILAKLSNELSSTVRSQFWNFALNTLIYIDSLSNATTFANSVDVGQKNTTSIIVTFMVTSTTDSYLYHQLDVNEFPVIDCSININIIITTTYNISIAV